MRDVIVVGAGPGGSSVAKELALRGYDVALYEKRQEIGAPKRCGEGLSSSSIERLNLKIPRHCIRENIKGAIVYAPNGKSVEISFDRVVGHILERKMFDKWMAEEAARAGAFVRAKTYIKELLFENGKVCGVRGTFEGEEFEERARVVVGADGVESKIGKMAGLKIRSNPQLMDSGYQYEMANVDLEHRGYLELYFGNSIAPRGYVWIFPKGKDVANVGIGIAGDHDRPAKSYLDDWITTKPGIRKGSILEVNAGGIPVGGFLKNMVTDNFLLVGDAAHQVNPIHGGGIAESITAGRIAASVIDEALQKGDTSARTLDKYNKVWWKERGEKLRKIEKLREVVEEMDDETLNFLASELSGRDLMEFTRGNRLGKLAKILMKKPGLVLLARKLL